MPFQIEENVINDLKKDARDLVSLAKNSASHMMEGTIIPECDAFKLTFYSGDIEEARRAVSILSKILPKDIDVINLSQEISNIHSISNKAKDIFTAECFCKKKI